MKFLYKALFSFFLLQPLSLQANFSDEPALVEISAKHAKLRAKIRATKSEQDDASDSTSNSENTTQQQVNINDAGGGCDLNVGNVLIDDTVRNPPDEVIIIIEGDIIQSNNCR